ncbi:MAG: prepilin-type N-terminal cleavage/methylation domain-containing protein [Campylobacter sp.]|uniref:pilus assembly FimT family protein n=1 Tax=Campylobacter sp. TaxID=205 RepID=UPI002AA81348|nr:prepilin-type N-terminal cleavage/methylation domain-containing protein [Campylobacter sp.]MCI7548911.1 prepilin-type N-terminal cleavage/methylation domain-containing protein [Campylobacter sp.]
MKKAFTLIELVFVMVVLGILTFALWPKKQPTQAFEAARQIVAHIRYTQHLALNDDKFATHTYGTGDSIAKDWYKRLWRITFSNTEVVEGCRNGGWRYAVYQNIAGDLSDRGQPNGTVEAASNPAQAGKVLSACYSGLSTNTSDELNLGQTYKIETIDFSQFTAGGRIQGIIFDELGRAYPNGQWTTPYDNRRAFRFSEGDSSYGRIILRAKDGSTANILVFGETGYACVENVDPGCNP